MNTSCAIVMLWLGNVIADHELKFVIPHVELLAQRFRKRVYEVSLVF